MAAEPRNVRDSGEVTGRTGHGADAVDLHLRRRLWNQGAEEGTGLLGCDVAAGGDGVLDDGHGPSVRLAFSAICRRMYASTFSIGRVSHQ